MSKTHYVPRCRRCRKIIGLYPLTWGLALGRLIAEGEHVDADTAVVPCAGCGARYAVVKVERGAA